MKKILISLLVLMSINLHGFAIVTTEDSTSVNYIKKHGHSDEMARLMDLQKAQINNTNITYKVADKWYLEHPPEWYDLHLQSWYSEHLPYWIDSKTASKALSNIKYIRKVFMHLDCGLDDEKFMQHNIDYTTRYDDL